MTSGSAYGADLEAGHAIPLVSFRWAGHPIYAGIASVRCIIIRLADERVDVSRILIECCLIVKAGGRIGGD